MATDNVDTLLSDEAEARCYHCLGEPTICPDTPVVDNSTALCPFCGVDAVVPASEVMEEEDLHAWRYLAFYAGQGVDVPKEEQTTAPSYTPEATPTPKNLKVLTRTESISAGSSRPVDRIYSLQSSHPADQIYP